jgi:hypothetical protein
LKRSIETNSLGGGYYVPWCRFRRDQWKIPFELKVSQNAFLLTAENAQERHPSFPIIPAPLDFSFQLSGDPSAAFQGCVHIVPTPEQGDHTVRGLLCGHKV